jgi:hypothetical protein
MDIKITHVILILVSVFFLNMEYEKKDIGKYKIINTVNFNKRILVLLDTTSGDTYIVDKETKNWKLKVNF